MPLMDAEVPDGTLDGMLVDDASSMDSTLEDGELPDASPADASVPDAMAMLGLLAESHRVFFVGNSYTGGVIGRYRSLAMSGAVLRDPFQVDGVSPGGRRLDQHYANARADGNPLQVALTEGSMSMPAWDVFVLQDQSQVPGFPEGNAQYIASRDGAVGIAGLVDEAGATVLLYMTWGRRDGDTRNPSLYPDFLTMQERLEQGYRSYARAIREAGYGVSIAPVGPAYRLVYQDLVDKGEDPNVEGSGFHVLYSGDGSHPSLEGIYLTSSVILGAILGEPMATTHTWAPDRISAERADALRRFADMANQAEWARE